ncbi:MAG TPA: ABC transporter permease, partial [Gammaproteobacteria bacterium]
MSTTPIGLPMRSRAWRRFRANRRGYYSLWLFAILFILSLFAEVLSNNKPLMVRYEGNWYFPVMVRYAETTFGGDFDSEADYLDPYVRDKITSGDNWALYPLNPYSYDTINYFAEAPNPAAPSQQNYLGTDDRGRDVLARLIYGFRISVLFAFLLTTVTTLLGLLAGAIQGYFGGRTDLIGQRVSE